MGDAAPAPPASAQRLGALSMALAQNLTAIITTDARPRALQVALPIPILAGAVGLLNSFRTMRLPDPVSSASIEGVALG